MYSIMHTALTGCWGRAAFLQIPPPTPAPALRRTPSPALERSPENSNAGGTLECGRKEEPGDHRPGKGPGMPVDAGGSWWLPCHGTCGSCLCPGLLCTPFLQSTATSDTAEPTNPLSRFLPTRHFALPGGLGAGTLHIFFSKARHAQTRKNMKGRRKG